MAGDDMGTLVVSSVIRGYHVYRARWEPYLGEEFVVLHEMHNDNDVHAMAVYRIDEVPGLVVGHLPREISRITHHFVRHEGKIKGTVTGMRKHCYEAGGMEIPCQLQFTGSSRNISRLKRIFEEMDIPCVRVLS